MKDEMLAQPVMKWFMVRTLLFVLCLSAAHSLFAYQGGQFTLPPSGSGQVQPPPAAGHPLTFEERGDIFMARKSYDDAVDFYKRALKQTRFANPIVWNKLGIAYQQLQDYAVARNAYNKAIQRQKDYTEPMNNIGTTYFMQKRYGKSVKYYLKAIKLSPESASYHLNLGTSYMHMKKYKESVDEYRTALSLDPNIFSQRSAFGTTMEARGADPEYYFYLGKVFASLGRAEEAVRSLRRALEDGFKDRKRILDDPDFMKISQNPAYMELMNNPPVGIKD